MKNSKWRKRKHKKSRNRKRNKRKNKSDDDTLNKKLKSIWQNRFKYLRGKMRFATE